ncbi:helix-turn-helix transcriptional regulator [Congregibacter brevis]|uniref:Helix-turn-helix transcriptional regulator n=1 Tax=Congregibacter brevis TaxID=3081201 RepID=A0ABZ0I9D7_9GAMM|nr:helix-turn-helix transcriptional regulator [Congregibacter sp. IMCC45268]
MKNDPRDKYSRAGGDDPATGTDGSRSSLIDTLIKRAGKVAGGTLDLAVDVATMSAMFGDSWVRDLLLNGASPERLEAMAEAGRFLRDAREMAGLTVSELSDRLDLGDQSVLEGVERGESILPLELMLRTASLLARHDPVPFLIKFLRSYNPQLEATLEQWGVMALPRNFERERRFVNLYRQHDFLRDLSDDGYQRFIEYMDSSTQLVVDVMEREASANVSEGSGNAGSKARAKAKAKANPATAKQKAKPRPRAKAQSKASVAAPSATPANKPVRARSTKAKTKTKTPPAAKPVVRKVKPRNSDR